MVYFKVTNGAETRKFRVTPGEVTFDQLREKIASLFPGVLEDTSDLTLKYRDAEGDIITLSSDIEFQEVLSELPVDHTWKMHISSPPGRRDQRGSSPRSHFSRFLEPSFGMRHHLWSGLDRELQETQELLNLLCGVKTPSTSKDNGDPQPSTSEAKRAHTPSTSEDKGDHTPSTSDKGDHTSSTSEDSGNHTPEDKVESGKKEETGEESEVKSKPSSESPSSCPAHHHPHCHIKTFGSWEPLVVGGLFGPTRRILGPVGYQITWRPASDGCRSTPAAGSA